MGDRVATGDPALAIIGGGAAAVLLLDALAQAGFNPEIAIDVYDRRGAFARGIAYGTPHPWHVLNVRAGHMSARRDDPEHFVRFIRPYGLGADDFAPRPLYGAYLQELWQSAQQRLRVCPLVEDVLASDALAEGGFRLLTSAGAVSRPYTAVILATGQVRPLRPAGSAPSGWYPDPWSVPMAELCQASTIAILGSGLSAVDILLSLHQAGARGRMTLVSRHGLLPAAHPLHPLPPVAPPTMAQSPLAWLRYLRGAAAATAWPALIDGLRPQTNAIWQGWSNHHRQQFQRHLLSHWQRHRHRLAPAVAHQLAALCQDGRVEFWQARISSIQPGPVLVTNQGQRAFATIINCLGYAGGREPGRPLAATATLGPAAQPDLFETTAIPEIRSQAADLADWLLNAPQLGEPTKPTAASAG